MNARESDIALLDALFDEDDETARVDVPPRSWRPVRGEIAALRAFAQDQLDAAWQAYRAQLREERLATNERRGRSLAVLACFTRDALLERLGVLQARHGSALQVAHRKRDSVSDDELRSLIADLQSIVPDEDDA